MYFRQILHEEKSCASYLVGCPTMGVCAVIDPQGEPSAYIDLLEGQALKVTAVIETHVHADHLSCARDLARQTGAPLFLGPGAEAAYSYSALLDGQLIPVGNRRIEVMHTPGHTPEHVCLRVDEWFVLTGDTLFVGDVGRVDLAHSDDGQSLSVSQRAEQLYDSLQRLLVPAGLDGDLPRPLRWLGVRARDGRQARLDHRPGTGPQQGAAARSPAFRRLPVQQPAAAPAGLPPDQDKKPRACLNPDCGRTGASSGSWC